MIQINIIFKIIHFNAGYFYQTIHKVKISIEADNLLPFNIDHKLCFFVSHTFLFSLHIYIFSFSYF